MKTVLLVALGYALGRFAYEEIETLCRVVSDKVRAYFKRQDN